MSRSPPNGLLQRKCACGTLTPGGGACAGCAGEKEAGAQRKLAIGSSNDPLEHEADRVAEQVLSARAPPDVAPAAVRIQRFTPHASGQSEAAPASVDRALGSPGRPLDAGTRQDMEQRFGHDFSQVRIHEGAAAEQSARDVGARAYTVGSNIAFAAGQFAPASAEGRRLLAHELTHVIQQGAGGWLQRQQLQTPGSTKAGTGSTTAPGSGKGSVVTPKDVPRSCGPEVSGWIVGQASKQMGNAAVLAVRAAISEANALAAKYDTSAQAAVEAGAAWQVASTESSLKKAGTVPPGDRPTADIATGLKGAVGFGTSVAVDFSGSDTKIEDVKKMYEKVTKAAAAWQELVGHGKEYDFKANVMKNPTAGDCPSATCNNTVTICGGSYLGNNYLTQKFGNAGNCYVTDVPGNLLYALIGKFVGFSERALQLGSQWAQLTSKDGAKWDPPQDTASISVGYSLPLSLTTSGLCSAVVASRSRLNTKPDCSDCFRFTAAGYK
jgi:hypothetical protein